MGPVPAWMTDRGSDAASTGRSTFMLSDRATPTSSTPGVQPVEGSADPMPPVHSADDAQGEKDSSWPISCRMPLMSRSLRGGRPVLAPVSDSGGGVRDEDVPPTPPAAPVDDAMDDDDDDTEASPVGKCTVGGDPMGVSDGHIDDWPESGQHRPEETTEASVSMRGGHLH